MSSDLLGKARVAAGKLKVFPLPPVVLLPGGAVPLHIFEPRYRALVADALATDGVFAMAQVQPGQERQLSGRPALEPWLCLGHIAVHEKRPDGRYDLVLTGVSRARLVRELPAGGLYREVEAELVPDDPSATPADPELRQALLELIARTPDEVGEKLAQVTSRVAGGPLADVVASAVIDDVERRYELLRELDVSRRVREVADDVLMLVAGMPLSKRETLLH